MSSLDRMHTNPSITEIRVRYGETDRAGVVYHANYLDYFEIGRTEMLRGLGAAYRQVEEDGVLLTVVEATLRYSLPARYDDLLRVETRVLEVGGAQVRFGYEVRRDRELLCTGTTLLAAIARDTGKVCRIPEAIRARLDTR